MQKTDKKQILQNIGSSWFSLGVNIAVGILLSPFILHKLGDAAFGIWVLIFSITGYYGLFDLGIRSSIVRYVSRYSATNDIENLRRLINTSLFGYTCLGVLSLLVTVFLSANMSRLFQIPADSHDTARWLILMVGASVALGFPLGIAGGVLEGLQRFYVLNWTNVAATLVRALLIVIYLKRGYGLLTAGAITIAVPLVASVVRAGIVLWLLPLSFGRRYIDRATLRQIAHYSSTTFVIMIAGRLKFKTDEIVIGTFLSAAAVTYFNIGARIVDYAGEAVTSLAQIFVPMSSQSDAVGNMDRLRKIFVAGNRSCALIIFPVCAILLLLGKSVIEAWVGAKYVPLSYPVLVIMLIPSTLFFAQSASGRVLFGMGNHRTWAFVSLAEGIANLVLSIALVQRYGIVGDAFGTAIPLTCSMLFFLPQHLCKQLGIQLRTFVREAYSLPLLLCVPLIFAILLLKRWFTAHTLTQLAIQLGIAGFVYGLGLVWAVRTKRALRVGELVAQSQTMHGPTIPTVESLQQDI